MAERELLDVIMADARWKGQHGVGRFTTEILDRLPYIEPINPPIPILSPFDSIYLTFLILMKRPKVYFSPGFNPPLWSPVPYIFTIHDLIHLRFPPETSLRKKLYYEFLIRPAINRSYRVLTDSLFSKKEIIEWSNAPEELISVVGCGVGNEFHPDGDKYVTDYPYILYVGGRKPHKNLHRLIAAFARSSIVGDVRLLISGGPDSALSKCIHNLNLDGKVVFTGFITDQDLPAYYRGALAVVIPSLYEGFGLPVIEAMATGTPVLASNVTSLPEVVDDAGLLVDPYSVDSISWGIGCIVEDTALREVLIKKGVERAKGFSWDRVAELTLNIIQSAL